MMPKPAIDGLTAVELITQNDCNELAVQGDENQQLSHKIKTMPLAELKKEERSAKFHLQSVQQAMVRCQTLDKQMTEEQVALSMMGTFNGIGATDTIEEMMAIQLMGLQNAVVESLQRAGHPKMPEEISIKYLNAASKASRAFAGIVDAMDKHRGDRAQKVVVEHVHVHAGGQAIVGNVEGGAGGRGKKSK